MNYALQSNGIFTPEKPVTHRDEEYDSRGFEVLRDMQSRHFWYRGRHRFLLRALKRELKRFPGKDPSAIDLGGGCGGWISYLKERLPHKFSELALSDSSIHALELAGPVAGKSVARYQTDLLALGWSARWDIAFLLDVLEHIPNDAEVLLQIEQALKPGGLLFVTTPALKRFWSYNDEMAHHVRRYSKIDFARLAQKTGLRLLSAHYFMFFLSPLLWLSRLNSPNLANMNKDEIFAFATRTHRVPHPLINGPLSFVFSLETPLGLTMPFPWGTSILGIFQKPN